jgi:hypothetical protein
MMNPLGLGLQKIDICLKLCMLYYLKNTELNKCRTYGYAHYKPKIDREITIVTYRKHRYFLITPRLQKLFMSPKTVEHMICHYSYDTVDGVMMHSSDNEA